MAFIRIETADLRDPSESNVTNLRIEFDLDCDGVVCGNAVEGHDGEPVSCVPHDPHVVVSGSDPEASPRWFAYRP